MQSRWSILVIFSLLAPMNALADDTSVERFTQSMSKLYESAEMCKNISTLHSENYSVMIRNYLHVYFKDEIPYWVLPEITQRLKSRDNCIFTLKQNLIHYQQSSIAYVEEFPGNPPPPRLDDYMMIDSRSYALDVYGDNTKSEHHLTPEILTRSELQ